MGAATAPPGGYAATAYPADVTYATGDLRRSRLTVFFRPILAIPIAVMWYIFSIGFEITTFLAWWAILFTGKYPEGLYSFGVNYLRLYSNFYSYIHYVTDEYPPWTGNDAKAATYPVQYSVSYAGQSNRLTCFFRIILAIPLAIFGVVVLICAYVAAIIAWFAILITGRYPEGLLNFVQGAIRSFMRIQTYSCLMTDEYAPFSMS